MSPMKLSLVFAREGSLGKPPQSAHQWHDFLEKGASSRSIDALKAQLDVADDVLAELLGVSEKTLTRARKAGGRLDAVTSDRLFRVAKIAALARHVFERQEPALRWLKREQPGLGGRTPLSFLTTSVGIEEVERLLLRIEHGVYS